MRLLKETKYLNFTEISDNGKTKIIGVGNFNGEKLAYVKWSGAWRKYCFFPIEGTSYDTSCLNDIMIFIKELMDERKLNKNA
jgi:hypothetical protein